MLFTRTFGDPASPAIVFLHGAGLSGRMWQPQMERLPGYYCLAPDLPEQGKSLGVGPFRLEDAARRVIELIDEHVRGKRAHLVGLSLGADLALAITQIFFYCAGRSAVM
ncbi:MAG: alpha/beta fold hydrolase [Ktedonobacteraceae bacterium]|nr:alpha/beta fold hydrolase [Ktedonobacteraceae bacterium]